eukprot:2712037-Rhodomonas_salina.1
MSVQHRGKKGTARTQRGRVPGSRADQNRSWRPRASEKQPLARGVDVAADDMHGAEGLGIDAGQRLEQLRRQTVHDEELDHLVEQHQPAGAARETMSAPRKRGKRTAGFAEEKENVRPAAER